MLPRLWEDLNHRYAGSIIGIKQKLEVKPFKVDRVEHVNNIPLFFGSIGERRKNLWDYDDFPVSIESDKLVLNTPTTGYINCYKESPMFAIYLERFNDRQYKRGINKQTHKLFLMKENIEMMRYASKLIPNVDTQRPRYLYYVYNRRYLPFRIAIDLIEEGKAYSVALNKRYALHLFLPYDTPTISFCGRLIGVFKDNKFMLTHNAKECSEELFVLTGYDVEVV
jgi:hypothetical protein